MPRRSNFELVVLDPKVVRGKSTSDVKSGLYQRGWSESQPQYRRGKSYIAGLLFALPTVVFIGVSPQSTKTPRLKKCYGCDRKFKSPSGILIHLESTSCDSGVSQVDIDRWAFNCDRSYLYTNGWKEELRYRCPSCEDRFPKVSGLLQHIETTACAATYSGILEKLRRYVKQQVQDVLG